MRLPQLLMGEGLARICGAVSSTLQQLLILQLMAGALQQGSGSSRPWQQQQQQQQQQKLPAHWALKVACWLDSGSLLADSNSQLEAQQVQPWAQQQDVQVFMLHLLEASCRPVPSRRDAGDAGAPVIEGFDQTTRARYCPDHIECLNTWHQAPVHWCPLIHCRRCAATL
jgi:hypothetical protein